MTEKLERYARAYYLENGSFRMHSLDFQILIKICIKHLLPFTCKFLWFIFFHLTKKGTDHGIHESGRPLASQF